MRVLRAVPRRPDAARSAVDRPPEQIAEDLGELAKVTKCIRTYSIDNGLDRVPELASKAGLKVLLGVWIGRDRAKNVLLINHAVALANDHPGVVTSLIVGSEVLLRGEMTASDLREFIRSAKSRVHVPVTYADVGSSGCATAKSPPMSISSPCISCPIGRTCRRAPKTPPPMSMKSASS